MKLPAFFLRLESLAIFIGATAVYVMSGYNGWLYLLLFFSFDVSLIGYAVSPRLGAITYNTIHNFAPPLVLLALGLAWHAPAAQAYALLWLAHIGFDRTIGFGLMNADRFGDTNVAVFPRLRRR